MAAPAIYLNKTGLTLDCIYIRSARVLTLLVYCIFHMISGRLFSLFGDDCPPVVQIFFQTFRRHNWYESWIVGKVTWEFDDTPTRGRQVADWSTHGMVNLPKRPI